MQNLKGLTEKEIWAEPNLNYKNLSLNTSFPVSHVLTGMTNIFTAKFTSPKQKY